MRGILYYFNSFCGHETLPNPRKLSSDERRNESGEWTLEEREPGLIWFWQAIHLKDVDQQWLSWMKKPQLRKSEMPDVPLHCWDRLKGFIFLDDAFQPDSHKTRLVQDDFCMQMFDTASTGNQERNNRGLSDQYKQLQSQLHAKLKEWNAKRDCDHTFEDLLAEERDKVQGTIMYSSWGTLRRGADEFKINLSDQEHNGPRSGTFVKLYDKAKSSFEEVSDSLQYENITYNKNW